eukprot:4807700-Prymnesium_polylepis.2
MATRRTHDGWGRNARGGGNAVPHRPACALDAVRVCVCAARGARRESAGCRESAAHAHLGRVGRDEDGRLRPLHQQPVNVRR